MCLGLAVRYRVLKESDKSRFDSYSVRKCIDHMSYYITGLSRVHVFHNVSRHSWKTTEKFRY